MYSWRYHPTLSLTKEPSLRNKSDAGVVPSSGIFCTSSMFFFCFLPGKVHVVHLLISFQSKGTLVVLKVQLCTINYCKSTVYSHFQVKDKYQRYKSTTVTKKSIIWYHLFLRMCSRTTKSTSVVPLVCIFYIKTRTQYIFKLNLKDY